MINNDLRLPEDYLIRNNRKWSSIEMEYLINNWNKKHIGNIAKQLNRTKSAIKNKIKRMKIK